MVRSSCDRSASHGRTGSFRYRRAQSWREWWKDRKRALSFKDGKIDLPLISGTDLEFDPMRVCRNSLGKPVGPFNHTDALAENNLIESDRAQGCEIFYPVKIEVVNRQAAMVIFMEKSKRRTRHDVGRAQTFYQAL